MESDEEEKERMIRQLLFLYHGRFTHDEAYKVFEHENWDMVKAFKFVMENESAEVRKVTGQTKDVVESMKTDPSIIDELQNGIKHETRQFACEPCDHAWWRKVPVRKQVSKCKRCQKKYDPVPKEFEWGWATYECECGNEFGGSGQRNTSAPCYECETSSFPVSIKPFWRRPGRKSRRRHCCNAPDCTGHSEVPIHEVDPNRVYDDGTTNKGPERPNVEDLPQQFKELDVNGPGQNYQLNHNKTKTTKKPKSYGKSTCVSDSSRSNKKRVIYPSEPHISTGSTIATFLSQSDDFSSYMPSLSSIPEQGGRRRGPRF